MNLNITPSFVEFQGFVIQKSFWFLFYKNNL